jgi:accessory colonization factor AcfC
MTDRNLDSRHADRTLRLYGPGGPYAPILECAGLYARRAGMAAAVVKDQPDRLAERLARDGDIHYTGAPYMMADFLAAHPGVLDEATVVELQPRRMGLMVRSSNPKAVRGVEDLFSGRLNLLDVALENMAGVRGETDTRRLAAHVAVTTGEQGLAAWTSRPDLDVWVTYRSWHVRVGAGADFLPIPGPDGLRATPVAVTRTSRHRAAALDCIAFFQTGEARAVFRKFGWE